MTHDYRQAETLSLSWQDMHRDACSLAELLRGKGPFDGIVAIARGGLVPAAIVAQELDIKLVETVCISSYDSQTQGDMRIMKTLAEEGKHWLVIDDLVDSGATAKVVRAMLPGCHYATLYAKPEGRGLVDTSVAQLAQHVWLVFPWEASALP
ncbi:xanthine phosphoribosyltransferase [Magnetospirillum sulfuroxidans]|uniref:Xanthine phosphoribosyltransferase n=1 Tax=Magnetospirillum sulfuroxidans TaxID=611300 RepID=A0ABS5IE33_9PROT|nr:xanthine phosphoribosyltransferase [Magnetospirillum sulfuroxidans]MBR9972604.1 xanthine phosphoribosyltransferase [Magnetospirillum sulfuroxidans]